MDPHPVLWLVPAAKQPELRHVAYFTSHSTMDIDSNNRLLSYR